MARVFTVSALSACLLFGCCSPGNSAASHQATKAPAKEKSASDTGQESEALASKWEGYATDEELAELGKMSEESLREFLKDFNREPALRVETMRLLVEKTEDLKTLFPLLLASLRAPTTREREASLYYFSRFGTPDHIEAIKASALDIEDCRDHSTHTCHCIDYSIECTIKQILKRAGEKQEDE